MTRISKNRLDKALEDEMFSQFWLSLSLLNTAGTAASFFTDLLSSTEGVMLAKRFTIAVLIFRGKKFSEIKRIIHVSDSTISSVNAWLKNAKPETRKVLETIIKDSRWQKLLDQFESLLDTLPLQYGTDWHQASKERRNSRMNRRARGNLL